MDKFLDSGMLWFCTAVGTVGTAFAGLFGGWSSAMSTLCIFLLTDYITGVLCALVFKKSSKGDGTFESNVGLKGLVKKCMVIILVFLMHRIDLEIGGNYLRDGSAIAFIVNEALSIVENMGLMGVPIPEVITNGISVLKDRIPKAEEKEDNHD